jgi:hypothetical protein
MGGLRRAPILAIIKRTASRGAIKLFELPKVTAPHVGALVASCFNFAPRGVPRAWGHLLRRAANWASRAWIIAGLFRFRW